VKEEKKKQKSLIGRLISRWEERKGGAGGHVRARKPGEKEKKKNYTSREKRKGRASHPFFGAGLDQKGGKKGCSPGERYQERRERKKGEVLIIAFLKKKRTNNYRTKKKKRVGCFERRRKQKKEGTRTLSINFTGGGGGGKEKEKPPNLSGGRKKREGTPNNGSLKRKGRKR